MTDNVSWNKPFGDSDLSRNSQNQFNNAKQNVNKQLGTTMGAGAGGALSPLFGTDPVTGLIIGGIAGNKVGQNIDSAVNATPGTNPPAGSMYIPPSTSFSNGAGPGFQNTDAETAFRNAYLKSLTPNTNFNINAEANPYKATSVPSTGPSAPNKGV